jgi:hypothetical protein
MYHLFKMFSCCPVIPLNKYSLDSVRILIFLDISLPDLPYKTYQYSNIKKRKDIILNIGNRPTSSGRASLLINDWAP